MVGVYKVHWLTTCVLRHLCILLTAIHAVLGETINHSFYPGAASVHVLWRVLISRRCAWSRGENAKVCHTREGRTLEPCPDSRIHSALVVVDSRSTLHLLIF